MPHRRRALAKALGVGGGDDVNVLKLLASLAI